MEFVFCPLEITGVTVIEHQLFRDHRGFFLEDYRLEDFVRHAIPPFVQGNFSRSVQGVLRGLHYQLEPAAVGKLVRCTSGRIYDVALDMRKSSPTYGRWAGVELSGEGTSMLYVPPGCAHGFCVLSAVADVAYLMTGYYSATHDRAVLWCDPDVGIEWPVREPLLSSKDAAAPRLHQADNNFA
jgi:dTDP-4-dehydrorhamnose 3,5-epimerase